MDAASALLTSARGQIDAALSTLAASLAFLASDAILEPLRAMEAPPVLAKPRVRSRRRATPAAVVEPVVQPEPSAPVADEPAASVTAQPTAPVVFPHEIVTLNALRVLGAGAHVALKIARAATNSSSVDAHKPVYTVLDGLTARGLLVKTGRSYAIAESRA